MPELMQQRNPWVFENYNHMILSIDLFGGVLHFESSVRQPKGL